MVVDNVVKQEEKDRLPSFMAILSNLFFNNFLQKVLRYYTYKLSIVHELLPYDLRSRHIFVLQFLA